MTVAVNWQEAFFLLKKTNFQTSKAPYLNCFFLAQDSAACFSSTDWNYQHDWELLQHLKTALNDTSALSASLASVGTPMAPSVTYQAWDQSTNSLQ